MSSYNDAVLEKRDFLFYYYYTLFYFNDSQFVKGFNYLNTIFVKLIKCTES